MDRRQKKTRAAILEAFGRLLDKRAYENITVQEIIDEADIGRSTFYAHFETKDELLRSMCTDIFYHVFNETLPKEAEYSSGMRNLELKLGHILYRLDEHRKELKGILSGDSARLFMSFLRDYLMKLFEGYTDDFAADVPRDYLLNHLVCAFAETAKWWLTEKNDYSPEETAGFYMRLTEK